MPVDEQQAFQEPELCNRVVRRVDCLQTFLAGDADSNICRLDHTNVIRTIANCESHGIKTVLDEFDH